MGTGCRAAHRRPIYATQICLNINIGCFLKIIALLIHAQSSYRGTRYGERHLLDFRSPCRGVMLAAIFMRGVEIGKSLFKTHPNATKF